MGVLGLEEITMNPSEIEQRIQRAKELDAKATKGPWEFWDNQSNQMIVANVKGKGDNAKGNVIAALGGVVAKTPEFQLISEYRTLCPALAADCERLMSDLRTAREAIEGLTKAVAVTCWTSDDGKTKCLADADSLRLEYSQELGDAFEQASAALTQLNARLK